MPKTPLEKQDGYWIKREDLNPTGSAKDRALCLQVENIKKSGKKGAVISSTGNAAISAKYFCDLNNIELVVFVSPKVNKNKLDYLKDTKTLQTDKPISSAIRHAKSFGMYLLRQSTDPVAQKGYQEIGREIMDQLPFVTDILVPVGSGTTLYGISNSVPKKVRLWAVQPASSCQIAGHFDKNYVPEDETSTDALGVKYLPLKEKLIKAIQEHSGGGIVVNEKELRKVNGEWAWETKLAIAGREKIIDKLGEYVVIICTGKKR